MRTPPEIVAYIKAIPCALYRFAVDNHLSPSNIYLYRDGLAMPQFDTLQKIVNVVGKPITITIRPDAKK